MCMHVCDICTLYMLKIILFAIASEICVSISNKWNLIKYA